MGWHDYRSMGKQLTINRHNRSKLRDLMSCMKKLIPAISRSLKLLGEKQNKDMEDGDG